MASNADLIDLAKRFKEQLGHIPGPETIIGLWMSTADALEAAEQEKAEAWRVASEQTRLERDRAEAAEQWAEAAEQRAEEAERDLEELSDDLDHHVKGHMAEYERAAALAAVVEKALERLHPEDEMVRPILASAPADALREVKAEVWREGVAAIDPDATDIVAALNPYRKEQP